MARSEGVLNKVVRPVEVAAKRHRERAQARGGSEQAVSNGRLKRIRSILCRLDCRVCTHFHERSLSRVGTREIRPGTPRRR